MSYCCNVLTLYVSLLSAVHASRCRCAWPTVCVALSVGSNVIAHVVCASHVMWVPIWCVLPMWWLMWCVVAHVVWGPHVI